MRRTLVMLSLAATVQAADFHPVIPRTWDDAAMTTLELPNARPKYSLRLVSADYYYRIPVRPIYRTYPVYPIDKEPPGYLEKLRQAQPVVEFDPTKLNSREDWIRAGELVFDAPITFEAPIRTEDVRDPAFLSRTGVPLAPDGSIPTLRYVVRKEGQVELGSFACGMCHTRIQPGGSIIKGAQGNFPGDRVVASIIAGVPWPIARVSTKSAHTTRALRSGFPGAIRILSTRGGLRHPWKSISGPTTRSRPGSLRAIVRVSLRQPRFPT
jgi:hypothetical protein